MRATLLPKVLYCEMPAVDAPGVVCDGFAKSAVIRMTAQAPAPRGDMVVIFLAVPIGFHLGPFERLEAGGDTVWLLPGSLASGFQRAILPVADVFATQARRA